MSGRVTRSTVRSREAADPAETIGMTHPNADQNECEKCSKCQALVSHDFPAIRCAFCGLCVHARCDVTLTSKSLKMVNDDRHPAICYQCPDCRIAHSLDSNKSTTSVSNEEGIKMESRMSFLEEQFKKVKDLVQCLINHDTNLNVDVQATKLSKPVTKKQAGLAVVVTETKLSAPITKKYTGSDVLESKSIKPANPKNKAMSPKATLSVICTNVPEATDTLLASRHEHDLNQWEKLCSQMSLKSIQPVSLTRLKRKPDSVHNDKPRLLKVVVQNEKELEDVLLSAYLLRNTENNSSRIFLDVPWCERSRKLSQETSVKQTVDRSIIILGVPEIEETCDAKLQNKHDFLQWKFLSDILKTNDVAVVDTFRIPKSPKYAGIGPRPLKLTLLRSEMLSVVKSHWDRYQNLLPRELRISSSTRSNKSSSSTHSTRPTDTAKTNAGEPVTQVPAKNDPMPTPTESASL